MQDNSIYEQIYPFCKIRNLGNFYSNRVDDPPPRVKFLISLIEKLEIRYSLDKFVSASGTTGYNIILTGETSSRKMVVAQHDIANPNIDNANDNSASVINAIATKIKMPAITVVLLDGEEVGGLGAERLAQLIIKEKFGQIDWILNLELTGRGGNRFFIGNYPGKLSDLILSKFKCPVTSTPFNDSVIFRQNGIDSCVINPLPILEKGESHVKWENRSLDWEMVYNCHSKKDSLDTISVEDMQQFVEEVILKILED